jgi:uncharacterized membrane-anchored protein
MPMSSALWGRVVALCLVIALAPIAAQAQTSAPQSQADREAEINAAYGAGIKAGTRGPTTITLFDQATLGIAQATLGIPVNEIFIPKDEGLRILRALGNSPASDTFTGLVLGLGGNDRWIVVVRYFKEGYIKDDDAKNWNADELLQNLKNGNDEQNKDRIARGFPELEIVGWIEKPTYNAATYQLVWSLSSKRKGAPDTGVKGINYNTYALGRDGYFSLNLLTNTERVDTDKQVAHTLLAGLTYNSGRRYEDFNPSTDHLAAYGIAALVGGLAAKKLGLLALIGVFALKFIKVIGIAVVAFFGGIWKVFGGRKKAPPDAAAR